MRRFYYIYSVSTDSGSDTSEDGEATSTTRQRKYDPGQWKKCRVQEVTALPDGIDGLTVYEIKTTKQSSHLKLLSDGRKWKKRSSTAWKGIGNMRYAD